MENVTERQLRARLRKAGYTLHKSRVKNIRSNNLGGYMIVHTRINGVVAGGHFELSLDGVREWTEYLEE